MGVGDPYVQSVSSVQKLNLICTRKVDQKFNIPVQSKCFIMRIVIRNVLASRFVKSSIN